MQMFLQSWMLLKCAINLYGYLIRFDIQRVNRWKLFKSQMIWLLIQMTCYIERLQCGILQHKKLTGQYFVDELTIVYKTCFNNIYL